MPAISFSVYKEAVRGGSKRQTMRLPRKRPIKKGDPLFLFWRQRTKQCERLMNAICTEVFRISLNLERLEIYHSANALLPPKEAKQLMQLDGFGSMEEFFKFFNRYKKHAASGMLELDVIRWKPLVELWM